ncbi:MAG: O-antigen ligase family protein [bacterium]
MIQALLVSGLTLILAYLTWVWGGLRVAWLPPAVWASCGLLVILLASAWMTARSGASRSRPLWRDAFFYFGLLFLGYLAIQWGNAGRVLYFDVGFSEWRYSQPPHAGWPSAFSRVESAQMVSWFFPAWVAGLTVRSPAVRRVAISGLLHGLVYSAGLLSIFGIVQFLTGTRLQYWLAPTGDGFFASFGYTNHAAAYFVLMGALAAGFLYREIFNVGPTGSRSVYRTVALVASLVLCLVGANLSLSRAGVILAWALAGFVVVYGLIRGWNRLSAVKRLNLAVATVAVLFVFYFAVAGFGKNEILKEFEVRKPIHHRLFPVLDNVNLAMGGRLELDVAAWRIWQDHKLLGIGGWGYRYLLALYLPPEEWKMIAQSPGKANVHCDILQFLAEFGVIGFGLMLATGMALMGPLFLPAKYVRSECQAPVVTGVSPVDAARDGGYYRREKVSVPRRDPLWVMGVIGLSLVLVFSLIDLPFRCPAILCTWVVILAALPKVTGVRNQDSQ